MELPSLVIQQPIKNSEEIFLSCTSNKSGLKWSNDTLYLKFSLAQILNDPNLPDQVTVGHMTDGHNMSRLAGTRPNSEIIGNFRKIENFGGYFI